jgi:hypothetical protein
MPVVPPSSLIVPDTDKGFAHGVIRGEYKGHLAHSGGWVARHWGRCKISLRAKHAAMYRRRILKSVVSTNLP